MAAPSTVCLTVAVPRELAMLTDTISDARSWRGDTVEPRTSWYYPLSERCLSALDDTLRRWRSQRSLATDLRLADSPCAGCAAELAPVLNTLQVGRGFAIIEVPQGRFPVSDLPTVYWLVGQMLGRPCAQNLEGTLLYDVRDTGQDVRYGARFSVTNAESSFHTDNSFGKPVDHVGLLCLHGARSGGLSQMISAFAVHNEMLAQHADVLPLLYEPFHIDRRGGVKPGEAPTIRQPVLEWDGQALTCRYLRYWIEVGHDKAGVPLTARQLDALDRFDQVLNDSRLRVEFALKPGDMYFINNRWILHNRTAFVDHAEPDHRRHLVRLWLRGACDL